MNETHSVDGVRIVFRSTNGEGLVIEPERLSAAEIRARGLSHTCEGDHPDRPRSSGYTIEVDGVVRSVCRRHLDEGLG